MVLETGEIRKQENTFVSGEIGLPYIIQTAAKFNIK